MLHLRNLTARVCVHTKAMAVIHPRTIFTIPLRTQEAFDLLDDDISRGMIENLLDTILTKTKKSALKTPEELFTAEKLNTNRLISGLYTSSLGTNLNAFAKASRGETLKDVTRALAARKDKQVKKIKDGTSFDKSDNPLAALQASPGGGKSTFLDMIGLLSSNAAWDPTLCPDETMREILNHSIPVPITFNNLTPWEPMLYDTTPHRALALRILHSFFVKSGPTISAFAKGMPSDLEPRAAIQACHVYMHMFRPDRTSLLLLVDEVRKTMDGSAKMVTLMGEVLSAFRYDQLNIVSTTLDSLAFQQAQTSSGRPILWASLDSLRQDQVEDMFLQAVQVQEDAAALLQKLPVVALSVVQRRTFPQPPAAGGPTVEVTPGHVRIENTESCRVLPPSVRIAISDCAGHPRSLEKLQEVFLALLREYEAASDWASKGSLEELRTRVLPMLGNALVTPTTSAMRVALEGVPLSLDEPVGYKTFADLITQGMFLNTGLKGVGTAVPKLSMLSLLSFAMATPQSPIAKCIDLLAKQEERAVTMAAKATLNTLEGTLFEMFIARWLQLRLLLAADAGKSVTLRSLFNLMEYDTANGLPAYCRREFPGRMVEWLAESLRTLQATPALANSASGENKVILFSGKIAAPGFDTLALLHDNAGKKAGVFVESRFSVFGGSNSETTEDIKGKIENYRKERDILLGALGIPQEDAVFVEVLNRRILGQNSDTLLAMDKEGTPYPSFTAAWNRFVRDKDSQPFTDYFIAYERYLQEGVVLLNRQMVGRALSPSLADRALFLMDLREK